jgi:hypothetical protein
MTTLAEAAKAEDAEKIERLEGAMLQHEQVECPLDHFFAPGVYVRQMTVPAGVLLVGHEHRFEHVCILLKGKMTIATPNGVETISAPLTFVAQPGRKVAYTHEECVWQNIHATEERDLDKIEEQFVIKSDTWCAHQENSALAAKMQAHILSDKDMP